MAELPPWLDVHPGDLAADYTRGLQIGTSIGQEKARLTVEQQRMQMEAQARAETAQREALLQQQRLAQEKAYHEAVVGVRQRQLDEAAKVNAEKTRQAAAKFAQNQQFNKLVSSGMNPMDAAFAAGVATPATAEQMEKNKQAAAAFADKVRHEGVMEAKGAGTKMPTMDIPIPPPKGQNMLTGPTIKGVPINSPLINQVMGTNAPPGTGTNALNLSAGMPVVPGQARNVGNPKQAPAPSTPESPFAEGTVLRSKKDKKKRYIVREGQPVEIPSDDAE